MAVFIVLWPYLLTTKLKFVIHHNLGHSSTHSVLLTNACGALSFCIENVSYLRQENQCLAEMPHLEVFKTCK